jgi:hypothetical protein
MSLMKRILSMLGVAILVFGFIIPCEKDETFSREVVSSESEAMLNSVDPSYKEWNPTWADLIGNEPRATTAPQSQALRDKVANGTIDTRGTFVDVPNYTIEKTTIGNRSVMPDSLMRWHNPLNSQVTNPNENTRWYQKDGNTQVFRVFPGDQNWQNSRIGAARSEAYSPSMGIRRDDGKVIKFSARYHIAAHNGSKDVKIFQSKATASGGFDPAWGVSIHVTAAGNVVIVKRGKTWERIPTGYGVGQSFNLMVTDDGLNYKVFINDVEMASGTWDRGNLLSVCRWGAYVQGGSGGILNGSVSSPQIVYISGARVTLH